MNTPGILWVTHQGRLLAEDGLQQCVKIEEEEREEEEEDSKGTEVKVQKARLEQH